MWTSGYAFCWDGVRRRATKPCIGSPRTCKLVRASVLGSAVHLVSECCLTRSGLDQAESSRGKLRLLQKPKDLVSSIPKQTVQGKPDGPEGSDVRLKL